MFGLQTTELLLILAVVLILFGARRLPQLGAAVGQTIRALKNGLQSASGEAAEDPAATPGGSKT